MAFWKSAAVNRPVKLSKSFSGALRLFAFWVANRSVGQPLLDGIDYSCIFEEPSALEQVFAIFANVIKLDEQGEVLNAKWAERRAAQFILQYVTGEEPTPPFEEWETELYDPPAIEDPLPWPMTP
ncbi:hypothetical protein CAP40_10330 [Sphingomonas sp. IBVSS2]|uniref:DUF7677 family protein n=1 Tax=Sphingomonas sp. IBVSS2 TaxID=1985172 RepID=UPI000A2D755A|nr:hypothetical protein [Sphingomonas sp. IBVSS2]OSZ66296.1 hypothetical protein CAP40_10330 [Sphingomonas sp. IBVSS2]